MKKYLSFLSVLFFLLVIGHKSFGQEVSNISFKQNGDQVVISFDLSGTVGDIYNATAYYSLDDGKTWTKLISVSGDLLNVKPGIGKTIYWEVLKDVTGIKGSISFRVDATELKINSNDKKGFLLGADFLGFKVGYIGKMWGISVSYLINSMTAIEFDTTKKTRSGAYLSATRNIISKDKYKWNIGPSFGLLEYESGYYHDEFDYGMSVGLTNELQFKKLYMNLGFLYRIADSTDSHIVPTLGVGIVF